MSRARFRLFALAILAANLALHVHALPVALGRYRNVEETYRAHVAWTFVHGLPPSWGALVYGAYEQGSLVASVLLVPVFAALGPTVLATKLVALAWSTAKLGVFLALAVRLLGRNVGLLAGALAALVPPGIAVREACAMGDIQDAQLLIFAHWWAWVGLRARPPDAPAWRPGLAFGALAGGSLAYALATLPSIAVALVLWPVGRVRTAAREAAWVVAGAALALAPVIANWFAHGVAFLAFRGQPLGTLVDFEGGVLASATLVTGPYVADALALHPLAPPTEGYAWVLAAHRAWLAALALAWVATIALAVRARSRRAAPFDPALAIVALHAAYLLAFAASSQRLHYWLFLLVPTGALLVARVAATLARAGRRWRVAAAALVVAHVALPVVAWWGFPAAAGPRPVWSQVAHRSDHWSTPLVAGKLLMTDVGGVGQHAPLTIAEAWGTGILLGGADASDEKLAAVAARASAPAARRFAAGVGYSRGWGRGNDDPRTFAGSGPFPPGPLRAAALAGYGQATGEALGRFDAAALDAIAAMRPEDASALATGLGDGAGFGFWHLPWAHVGPFVPDALWADYRHGLLARLARDFPQASDRARLLPRAWDAPPTPVPPGRSIRHVLEPCAFTADDAEQTPRARTAFALHAASAGLVGVWVNGGASTAEAVRLSGRNVIPVEGSLLTNRRERLAWIHLGATVVPSGRIELELTARGATPRIVELVLVPGDPQHD